MKSLSEKECMKKYNAILRKVIKTIGNKITTNIDLDNYLKQINLKNYSGIYMVDEKFPKRKNSSLIINTDKLGGQGEHWIAVYQSNSKFYIYDSFGRTSKKIIPKFIKGKLYIDSDLDAEQHHSEVNCGQRSMAWLIFREKYGIYNALKI
jgi:hypothetical protein